MLKLRGATAKLKQKMFGMKENVDGNIIKKRNGKMICPECENKAIVIDCKRRGKKALYRRYECKGCKKRFSTMETYFVARETKNVQYETKEKSNAALEIVAIELGKAKAKHPEFPQWNSERLSIISEELGELAAAINDGECKDRQIEEAAHIAVTAIRFIEERLK